MSGRKKAARVIGGIISFIVIVAILAAAVVLCVNGRMIGMTRGRIVYTEEAKAMGADCILVLGAGVNADGSPSLMLADRLDTAFSLYKAGVSDRILMSGDHGSDDYDEVSAMKDAAIRAGIPSDSVFMDHAGFITYDSIYRARDVFGAKKIVIVTQRYHLYRALWIAYKLGVNAVGVAAPGEDYSGQLYRDLREMGARVKAFAMGILKTAPRYLGEPISLTGSGDVTNDEHFVAVQG